MSDKEKGSVCSDQFEMVPPEGGWGYLVCVGLSVIFIAGTAHQPVFGFIYNDFLDELGVGCGAVTVIYGVFQITVAIAGFSANIALKRLSLRQVGLIGAFIYTLASFLGIFVVSATQLIITNGFLQGLGMGLLIPVSYTSFNAYFTEKKVLYLSLCKASIGLITMVYPLFIKFTITEYGFRGTLAILCAISMHSIFGALVMHPVQWHMIKKPKPCEKIVLIPPTPAIDQEKEQFNFTKPMNTILADNAKSAENLYQITKTPMSDMLFVPKLDTRRLSIPVVLITGETKNSKFDSRDNVYLENLYKAASVNSLGNFGGIAVQPMPIIKNKEGKWQTVAEFLDLTLLKDFVYDNIIVGMAIVFFSDLTFFTLEPLFLDKNNLSRGEIANIIAIGGATDMSARLFLGVAGQFFRMNSRYMFYSGALFAAIFRIVFIQFSSYLPLLILTGILGALRSLVHISQPIVMADHVPIERYPPAYGLYMLLAGVFIQFSSYLPLLILTGILGALRSLVHISQPIVMADHVPIERYPPAYGLYMLLAGGISITIGPMIGFVRDITGSYYIAFSMLALCNMVCVVPWTIEAIIKHIKRRNKNLKT